MSKKKYFELNFITIYVSYNFYFTQISKNLYYIQFWGSTPIKWAAKSSIILKVGDDDDDVCRGWGETQSELLWYLLELMKQSSIYLSV